MLKYIMVILFSMSANAEDIYSYRGKAIVEDSISATRFVFTEEKVSFYFSVTGYEKGRYTSVFVNGQRKRTLLRGSYSDMVLYDVTKSDKITIKVLDGSESVLSSKLIYSGEL